MVGITVLGVVDRDYSVRAERLDVDYLRGKDACAFDARISARAITIVAVAGLQ
jgi:hypothetical protein